MRIKFGVWYQVPTGVGVAIVLIRLLLPSTIPYLVIGFACIIPPALCLLLADKMPRFLVILLYVGSSALVVWFLALEGDHLLPYGAESGGRHSVPVSGGFLAAWTGLVLGLMGVVAAWALAADALAVRRTARRPKSGLGPHAPPPRRPDHL